jgi:Na+-translocating ferredoxin:NAD+ oxidoreductase RnfD subunit
MKFSLAKGPFLRDKRSTTGIMLELFVVLSVVWLTSVVSYSIRYNFTVGLRGILVGLVSLGTTLVIDVAMALVKGKRDIKSIGKFVLTSYSYVTAIIFALCLPIGVSLYAVVVGAIVATLFAKYLFGGFGYNIFNPAIIGRIFVGLAFGDKLNYGIQASANNSATYDFVTGSTVTGSIDWSNGIIPDGFDWKTLLFGNYDGAMGETFTILLIAAAIYLIIRGIINYRLVGSYVLTILGISLGLGLFYKVDNVLSYSLLQLVTGGLLFGAVFMITDPVTSPKSMNGKIIFGIGAAALTMFIRINSDYPEGVMFSIALMNMLNPLIDSCIKGTTNTNLVAKWIVIAAFFVGAIGVNVGYTALYPLNAEETEEEEGPDPNAWLERYTITKVDDGIYEVSSRANDGVLKLKVYLDAANEVVTKVELLEANANEYYHMGIENYTDYNTFVGDDLGLLYSTFDVFECDAGKCSTNSLDDLQFDVETGATYTSSAFIGNIKAVIETDRMGGAQ